MQQGLNPMNQKIALVFPPLLRALRTLLQVSLERWGLDHD